MLRRRSSGSRGVARPSCRSTHDARSGRLEYSVAKTPSSTRPAPAYVRATHQAVSRATAIRASPTVSPICHGGRFRCSSMSNSGGMRKSRSRRVAKRMSPRMRETRKVRMSSRSRSLPITYQTPFSGSRAYGLSVRSLTSSREIDQ